MHLGHISHLLLQLVSAMKSHLPAFSLHQLGCSHDVCLHLLTELLKSPQPSSLASTPSTPTMSSSVGRPLSLDRASREPGTKTHGKEVLSSEELRFDICNTFLSFFSTFLETRFIPDDAHHRYSAKELHRSFSSACQALVLVAKLMSKSKAVVGSSQGEL